MQCHDDDRRARHHARARAGRGRGRPAERQRLDRRPRGDARSAARRAAARTSRRSRRWTNLRAAGVAVSRQHADQPAVDARAARRARDVIARTARTAGRSSSPWRWAAPPTSPTCCSSRTTCSSCSRCSRALKQPLRRGERDALARQQHRLLRPVRVDAARHACRAGTWRRAAPAASTLGIEADGAIKGCPSLPTEPGRAATSATPRCSDIWERSAPLRYTRDRTVDDLWGYCRTCYYADECRAGCTWTASSLFGKPGNNPFCHHRALEMRTQGKRERLVQVAPAPGEPFDHGRFEIVVEEIRMSYLVPCPACNRHVSATRRPVRSAPRRCPTVPEGGEAQPLRGRMQPRGPARGRRGRGADHRRFVLLGVRRQIPPVDSGSMSGGADGGDRRAAAARVAAAARLSRSTARHRRSRRAQTGRPSS